MEEAQPQWSKGFTNDELREIEDTVQAIHDGIMTLDEIEGECSKQMEEEIKRRVHN